LSKPTTPKTAKSLSAFLARIADGKLAKDITIMELEKLEGASVDFFVICTCESEPQLKAVTDAVEKGCIEVGLKRPRVEGYGVSQWVLLDFFDVVMHLMMPEPRNFYKLEKLWSDAVFYNLSEKGRLIKSK